MASMSGRTHTRLAWGCVLGALVCLTLTTGAQAQEAFEAADEAVAGEEVLCEAYETPASAAFSADVEVSYAPVELTEVAEDEGAYEQAGEAYEPAVASEPASIAEGEPAADAPAAADELPADGGAESASEAAITETPSEGSDESPASGGAGASSDEAIPDEADSDAATPSDASGDAAGDDAVSNAAGIESDEAAADDSSADGAASDADAAENEATAGEDAADPESAADKNAASEDVADADTADENAESADADEGVEAQANTPAKLSGWQVAEGKRYYYGADGKPLTGWQTIDGEKYYFESDGAARTGYYCDGSTMYFFDSLSGFMLKGEHFVHDAMRNFEDSGAMSTGLTSLPSGQTALYSTYDGSITCGEQYAGGSWHYFDDTTGYMLTRWQERRRVLNAAYSCLGQSEEQAWSYLSEVVAEGGSWCEYGPCISTVRHFFKMAGMEHFLCDGYIDGWPHRVYDYARAHGQVSYTPQVGDVVIFNWVGSFGTRLGLSACHAELVVEVGNDYVVSIGAIYTGIQKRTYWFSDITGYIVPAYYR